jgi:hypothetical protein
VHYFNLYLNWANTVLDARMATTSTWDVRVKGVDCCNITSDLAGVELCTKKTTIEGALHSPL